MNSVLNSDINCDNVNNCCYSAYFMHPPFNNIDIGTQNIVFTPSSPHNVHTPLDLAFVDTNKASDKVDIHIDRVDFFYDNWHHGINFPYYLVFLHGINDPNRRGFYYASLILILPLVYTLVEKYHWVA